MVAAQSANEKIIKGRDDLILFWSVTVQCLEQAIIELVFMRLLILNKCIYIETYSLKSTRCPRGRIIENEQMQWKVQHHCPERP